MSLYRPAMRAAFVRCFAAVSAADVKVLRDRTGAPMLDCKEALKSCDGDTSKAIDWLRQKGISKGELGRQLLLPKNLTIGSCVQVFARCKSRTGDCFCRRRQGLDDRAEQRNVRAFHLDCISYSHRLNRDFVAMNASFHKLAATIASVRPLAVFHDGVARAVLPSARTSFGVAALG